MTAAKATSKTTIRSPTPAAKAKPSRPLAKTVAPRAVKSPVRVLAAATATTEPGKGKHKLVRDSFTIPKSEYAILQSLKLRTVRLRRPTKKSELIRAGIVALAAMPDKSFLAAVEKVPSIKTGRPSGVDVEAKS